MRILVDPILVGSLDFGIPWLYDAAKKFLKNFKVIYPCNVTDLLNTVLFFLIDVFILIGMQNFIAAY